MKNLEPIKFAIYDEVSSLQKIQENLEEERKKIAEKLIEEKDEHKKLQNQILTQELKYIDGKIQGYLESIQIIDEISNIEAKLAECRVTNYVVEFEVYPQPLFFKYHNVIYIEMKKNLMAQQNKLEIEDLLDCQFSLFDETKTDLIRFNFSVAEWKTSISEIDVQYIDPKITIRMPEHINPSDIRKVVVNFDDGTEKVFGNFNSILIEKTIRISDNKEEKIPITVYKSS